MNHSNCEWKKKTGWNTVETIGFVDLFHFRSILRIFLFCSITFPDINYAIFFRFYEENNHTVYDSYTNKHTKIYGTRKRELLPKNEETLLWEGGEQIDFYEQ